MPGVLFWNVHMRNPDSARVHAMENTLVEIVAENDCDILVLAEYGADTEGLCDKLSVLQKDFIKDPPHARLKILANSWIRTERVLDKSSYYALHSYHLAKRRFILCGVHLPSKLDGGHGAKSICADLWEAVVKEEHNAGHQNVILVGDFNLNPFEDAIVDFDHLHAIFDADTVVKKRCRQYLGREKPLFYNPSWNLLGEFPPKGSYWRSGSDEYQLYWNLYDQVIMSADMVRAFCPESLKLITHTGTRRFLNPDGKPNVTEYSDHLPLYFSFQEERL